MFLWNLAIFPHIDLWKKPLITYAIKLGHKY